MSTLIIGQDISETLTGTDEAEDFLPWLGDDVVFAGDGNDRIFASDSRSVAGISEGNDTFYGEGGADYLDATGGLGDHLLDGGTGNDILYGGNGQDTLIGGADNDVLSVQGNTGNHSLDGGTGDDALYAGSGLDTLVGGANNDTLTGGNGNNTLLGGDGNDVLTVQGYSGNHSLDGGTGDDSLFGGNGLDTLAGGADNDSIYGGDGNSTLIGGSGNDLLNVFNKTGNYSLDGGEGNDSLYGGSGNDTLISGTGSDWLSGGAGNDRYQIDSRDFYIDDSAGVDSAVVSTSFVKVSSAIESVTYSGGAVALPYWIDALLPDSAAWFGTQLGSAKTYNFAFPSALPSYNTSEQDGFGFQVFNTQQQAFARSAFSYVSSVLDLNFVETSIAAAPNTITLANNSQVGSGGYASYPSSDFTGGDVFINGDLAGALTPADGEFAALALIHELGHAMGLKHPFDDPDSVGLAAEGPYLPIAEDSTAWTVMSYTTNPAQYHLTYSPLDIAALQYLYGPSKTARATNDTYNVSNTVANFVWDGAGVDTLSASGLSVPVTLYLEPGYWGFVGSQASTISAIGQVTVNFGTVIENLLGGSGSDLLVGNATHNLITGGGGNDTLEGGGGSDTAVFSGPMSQYTLTQLAMGWQVDGLDGIDTLTGFEFAQFSDQTVSFSALNQVVTPVLNTAFEPILPTVTEGASNPLGISVGELIPNGAITGGNGGGDAIAIEAVNTSLGTWQYSVNAGVTWLNIHADLLNSSTNTLGFLLGPTDQLRLLPFSDLSGSLVDGLTFRAWNFTSGSAGQYVVTTPGAGNNFSAASDTVTVNVTAVNDAPSFAPHEGNGLQYTTLGNGYQLGDSVAVLPDGKILTAGSIYTSGFGIARLNADGSLDTSFGSGGKSSVPIGSTGSDGNAMLVQPDGKIVMVGIAWGSNQDFGILRLNADGSLDSSFGAGGKLVQSLNPFVDGAYGLTLQTDGKILLAGSTYDGDSTIALLRLNSNGSVDSSFGTGGSVSLDNGTGATSVVMQADGKIVVASMNFGVMRLNADGTLDTGFGVGGKATVGVNPNCSGVLVQPDGKIVVVGTNLVRLNADGSLDTDFGVGGTAAFGASGADVVITADGNLLVANEVTDNTTLSFQVTRVNANGTLDTSFGSAGRVTVPLTGSGSDGFVASGHGITVQPDGRIVMTGEFYTGNNLGFGTDGLVKYAVLRLNTDGSLDNTFAGNPADTLGGQVAYTEGGAAVLLAGNVWVHDAELDALNAGTGNYSGASVTLVRNGGADAHDLFSATGTLAPLTQGSSLMLGATTIGTVTNNSAGTLVLDFNAQATQALVNSALRQIAYRHGEGEATGSVQINWSFSDGNTAAAQGSGGALAAIGSVTVNINVAAGGTSVDLIAYSWKTHTLLEGVSVSNDAEVHVSNGLGAIHLEAIAEPALTLAATRPVPATEAAATNSAVNLQDAIAILKMIVGLDVNGAGKALSPYQSLAADFDTNGTVNLTDAIGVLKHVVGLTSPEPTWHFLNEADLSVPAKANLTPGVPAVTASASLSGASPVHVGLVGYLSGDVDGSYAGAVGAPDLDVTQPAYFQTLTVAQGLQLSQFGVYA